jgi:hypothetical protein
MVAIPGITTIKYKSLPTTKLNFDLMRTIVLYCATFLRFRRQNIEAEESVEQFLFQGLLMAALMQAWSSGFVMGWFQPTKTLDL